MFVFHFVFRTKQELLTPWPIYCKHTCNWKSGTLLRCLGLSTENMSRDLKTAEQANISHFYPYLSKTAPDLQQVRCSPNVRTFKSSEISAQLWLDHSQNKLWSGWWGLPSLTLVSQFFFFCSQAIFSFYMGTYEKYDTKWPLNCSGLLNGHENTPGIWTAIKLP